MRLLNNSVLIKLDEHFDKILDSTGKPMLHLVTMFESFQHTQTSGVITAICDRLTNDYLYGTTIEVKPGDRAIFHYLAIDRDRDGHKIVHNKKIGDDYIIKYSDIFCVIRDKEIIMVNGFCILEGEPEEFKSNLIIPDYLKKKRSKVVCTIRHLGSCVSYNNDTKVHSMDFEPDEDEFTVGQKVVIPSWAAIPLMQQEHSLLDREKVYYRCQRRWMTDYSWAMSEIEQWQREHPEEESEDHSKTVKAYNNFIRQDAGEHSDVPTSIVHKQTTKHKRLPGRVFVP